MIGLPTEEHTGVEDTSALARNDRSKERKKKEKCFIFCFSFSSYSGIRAEVEVLLILFGTYKKKT